MFLIVKQYSYMAFDCISLNRAPQSKHRHNIKIYSVILFSNINITRQYKGRLVKNCGTGSKKLNVVQIGITKKDRKRNEWVRAQTRV